MSDTRAIDEAPLYSAEFLMTALPDFLEEVWRRDSRRPDDLLAALSAVGLTVDDDARVAAVRPAAPFRFRLAEAGEATLERKLRAAVTKRLGKASGDDRAWNIGRFRAGLIASATRVEVRLFAVYAVTEMRAAAVEWLEGTDAEDWAIRHRFIDGRSPSEQAADASREHFVPRSYLDLDDEESPRVTLLLPATTRAPGSRAADDAGRLADIESYVTEALGPATEEGRWARGAREFTLRPGAPTSRRPYVNAAFATVATPGPAGTSGPAATAPAATPAASDAPPATAADSARPKAPEYSPDHLLTAIPALIDDLWRRESRDADAILAAFEANGLAADDVRPELSSLHPYAHLVFTAEPDAGFERRLRAAITKRVGKPSGTDKHWNLGHLTATVTATNRSLGLRLSPEYSAIELRDAAADWLQGAEATAWAARHRYLDDRSPLDRAADSPPRFFPSAVRVYLDASPGPRATFFMAPGTRAPGTRPDDDDARLASVEQYLTEALGPAEGAGRWVRENRVFTIRRMRSRTRSIEFRTL
ncbi:hypothetical protein [Microbacterium galbinum]|uniref:hypothetical protein n=1 Tax=Microbacterium galbinum TaxID=2851646 RepID=UPI001FFD4770|nr:hypothetical protein [Microbacterium galbinum]MCK2030062.1 hypothetical protein [Microbacterium galbinum]